MTGVIAEDAFRMPAVLSMIFAPGIKRNDGYSVLEAFERSSARHTLQSDYGMGAISRSGRAEGKRH